MRTYSAAHLSDSAVTSEAHLEATGERSHHVRLLVLIAEIDARKLHLPAGYPSMTAYCMEEFRFSEDEAEKRIHAARTARRFPVLFEALDEGRLCITAVSMMSPHLTAENIDGLVQAASTCQRLSEIRALLQRFTKPDLLDSTSSAPAQVVNSPALERVSGPAEPVGADDSPKGPPSAELVVEVVNSPAPERVSAPLPEVEWVELRVKVRKSKLQHARDLLSHTVPSGNAIAVFDRALDALISRLEKRKYAACKEPRAPRPRTTRDRCIPAHVRRAVWQRDTGQCTFVSDKGRRCASRRTLEFDHVQPVARGGKASVEGIRLRCRGHNQYEAEQAFGAGFMQRKRQEAQRERAEEPVVAVADGPPPPGSRFREDVIAGLRSLGVSATEARLIVERSGALQKDTFEESMRAALRCCGPRRGVRSG